MIKQGVVELGKTASVMGDGISDAEENGEVFVKSSSVKPKSLETLQVPLDEAIVEPDSDS